MIGELLPYRLEKSAVIWIGRRRTFLSSFHSNRLTIRLKSLPRAAGLVFMKASSLAACRKKAASRWNVWRAVRTEPWSGKMKPGRWSDTSAQCPCSSVWRTSRRKGLSFDERCKRAAPPRCHRSAPGGWNSCIWLSGSEWTWPSKNCRCSARC